MRKLRSVTRGHSEIMARGAPGGSRVPSSYGPRQMCFLSLLWCACGGVVDHKGLQADNAADASPVAVMLPNGESSGVDAGEPVEGLVSRADSGGPYLGDYAQSGGPNRDAGSPDVIQQTEEGGYACVPYPAQSGGPDGGVWVDGWHWNVECPLSIAGFCATGGADGAPCVSTNPKGNEVSTFCAYPNVSSVAVWPSCHGFNVVSVFGTDACMAAPELFTTYFYDETTGALAHVDSDAIPSYTKCLAGVSGSRFSVYQCASTLVDCSQASVDAGGRD